MKAVFLRTPYNYDRDAVSDETGLSCGEPSLAVQSSKDECDINNIMKKFGLHGTLPSNVRAPVYADFSGIPSDYQSALNAVLEANSAFMQMPAEVRARFDNDPGRFVDFCSDPQNREEATKLGLVVPTTTLPDAAAPAASNPPSGGA